MYPLKSRTTVSPSFAGSFDKTNSALSANNLSIDSLTSFALTFGSVYSR